jgi:hypothetical protein
VTDDTRADDIVAALRLAKERAIDLDNYEDLGVFRDAEKSALVIRAERTKVCGSFGCILPAGHNMGRLDIPENHQPPEDTMRNRAIETGVQAIMRAQRDAETANISHEDVAAAVVDAVIPVIIGDALVQWRAVDNEVFDSAEEAARNKLLKQVTALKPDEFGRISKGLVQAMIMGEVE